MRQSGVLLHITSLPSRGGVGTLGQAAYDFVDFVKDAGMTVWQVLPIGPTGYGESPYQSTSVFAGNPLLISCELLEEEVACAFCCCKILIHRRIVGNEHGCHVALLGK